METLKVDIVSPSGQLVSNKKVGSLTVPATSGELTVLPGHIDLVCLLDKGVLKLDNEKVYIVYKGIMEITDGSSVVIAAERTTLVSGLNKQEVLASIKDVENKLLKETLSDVDFEETYRYYQDHLAELSAFN